MRTIPMRLSAILILLLLARSASAVVTIDWVTVGGAGNACDTQASGCFGTVAAEYRISKFEVSNAQYTEFLNAVAATDTNALYNTNMADPTPLFPGFGGITRAGSSGSFTYSTIAGRENMPVNHVSFWDSVRFANWLHNGQPTGAQDATTTEDGAYLLTSTNPTNALVSRLSGANVFIPTLDEWYKAAYYSTGAMIYFDYSAGSDTQIVCATAGSTANTANCNNVVGDMTDLGSYPGAASPNGTLDQGGNVYEWNETIPTGLIGLRHQSGGAFNHIPSLLSAENASFTGGTQPDTEGIVVGFRVAAISAPVVPSLSPLGIGLLLGTLLGAAGYWRRHG